jgi:exosome complex component RRP41
MDRILISTQQCPLTSTGLRVDGRRPYELRSVSMTFSPQAHADGSATMQQGLTTVTVSVFGPREPRSRANAIHDRANLVVEVGVAGWSQPGVGQRNRGDK